MTGKKRYPPRPRGNDSHKVGKPRHQGRDRRPNPSSSNTQDMRSSALEAATGSFSTPSRGNMAALYDAACAQARVLPDRTRSDARSSPPKSPSPELEYWGDFLEQLNERKKKREKSQSEHVQQSEGNDAMDIDKNDTTSGRPDELDELLQAVIEARGTSQYQLHDVPETLWWTSEAPEESPSEPLPAAIPLHEASKDAQRNFDLDSLSLNVGDSSLGKLEAETRESISSKGKELEIYSPHRSRDPPNAERYSHHSWRPPHLEDNDLLGSTAEENSELVFQHRPSTASRDPSRDPRLIRLARHQPHVARTFREESTDLEADEPQQSQN